MPPFKRLLLTLTLSVLLLAAFTYFWFAPLELQENYEKLSMRLHGVSSITSNGLHAAVRDHCRPNEACVCVALIHGMSDSSVRWRKMLNWSEKAWESVGLKDTRLKIYAWDLPGTNSSEPPTDVTGYRVRAQAEAVRKAMEPICPRWTVVGNSLGGWISAWLALEWPIGVEKLLLVDTAGMKMDYSDPTAAFFLDPKADEMMDFTRKLFYTPPYVPDRVPPMLVARMKRRHTVEIVKAQVADDFLEGHAASIHRPTMVLWGEADRVIPMDKGKGLTAMIPGAQWRQIAKCGHLPESECPRDLAQAIADMVKLGRF